MGAKKNPERSSVTKIDEHIPCENSMSTIWEFDHTENKHTSYRGKQCMKKLWFFKRTRRKYNWLIDFERKKMLPLTKKELKSHEDAKEWYICGKRIQKISKNIKYRKIRDYCHYSGKYRGAASSICNLKFKVPNEIPAVFHNMSNYDYNFIIKELANEFERQFECFEENKEKYKTFSVPVKREIEKIDKDGNESVETICYKIIIIDSMSFIATSLSKLVDNLTEGICQIKCKIVILFLI